MNLLRTLVHVCVPIALFWALAACGGSTAGGPEPTDFAPHCTNGVRDFQETDVDCGGPCGGCGLDATCYVGDDCRTGACGEAATCIQASCANGSQDLGEDAIDCGSSCGACLDEACGDDTDCAAGYCAGGRCAVPSCADGVANGRETDLDCGGGDCAPCATGLACVVDPQCATGICTGDVCRDPSCTDGRLNQDETAVDCGGVCPGCAYGQVCGGDADCASLRCGEGLCACSDARFVGPACDQCADERFMPPSCNNCADPRFTGEACDQCANPRFTGPACDVCVDPRFTGPECTACADAQFGGAECDQCLPGTHLCGDDCAPDGAVETCGTRCAPCPAPANGVATCNGTSCAFTCDPGFHRCGESCVPNTSVDTCGTGCEPCATVPDGTATCDGQACGIACDDGTHMCDGLCVDRASPTACGADCRVCPDPASGNGAPMCDESEACRVACDAGFVGLPCESLSGSPAVPAHLRVLAARRLPDGAVIVVLQGLKRYLIHTRPAGSDTWSQFVGPELPRDEVSGVAIDDAGRVAALYLASSTGPLKVDLVVAGQVTTLSPPARPDSPFTSLSHGFIETVFFGRDGRIHVIGKDDVQAHARWSASAGWETVALPFGTGTALSGIRDVHERPDGTFAALLPSNQGSEVRVLTWSFGAPATARAVGVTTTSAHLAMDDQGNTTVLALTPGDPTGPQTLTLHTLVNAGTNLWTAETVGAGANLEVYGIALASDGWPQAVVRGDLDDGGAYGAWYLQRGDREWTWTAVSTTPQVAGHRLGAFQLDAAGKPMVLHAGTVYE